MASAKAFLWAPCFGVFVMFPAISNAQELPHAADAGWLGTKVCEIISEDDQIRVMHCVIAARGGHERHYHLPNIVYTLKGGQMRILQEGASREVAIEAGQVFTSEERVVHEVTSLSDHDQSYLIIEKKY